MNLIRHFDSRPQLDQLVTEVEENADSHRAFELWAATHLLVIILLEFQEHHHRAVRPSQYLRFYETYMEMRMPPSVYQSLGKRHWEDRLGEIISR